MVAIAFMQVPELALQAPYGSTIQAQKRTLEWSCLSSIHHPPEQLECLHQADFDPSGMLKPPNPRVSDVKIPCNCAHENGGTAPLDKQQHSIRGQHLLQSNLLG